MLYVEDEKDVRDQTALILRDFFGEVLVAEEGKEALRLFKAHRVDAIVTDILMPGMNGLELIKNLRELSTRDVPTLITTAFTDTEYLLEAIRQGVDGYILKPINVQELIASIHKALLPVVQSRELGHYRDLINALGLLLGGKKIEILQFLINHLDEENLFHGSYGDIMEAIDVSKPTVIRLFKDLIDAGALERVKNGLYRFKSGALTAG